MRHLLLSALTLLLIPAAFAQPTTASSDGYIVQAGVFADQARAYGRAATLNGARVVSEDGAHRVIMGPFATLAEASAVRVQLQARGVEGFVRAAPQQHEQTVLARALPTPVQALPTQATASAPTPRRTVLSTLATPSAPIASDARRW